MHNESLMAARHTLAHLLAAAVLEHYPHAKPTLGPAIDTGFYYDFDFSGGGKPGEADFPTIEATMRKLLATWDRLEEETVSEAVARERFAGNPYKLELIGEIVARGEPLTLYHSIARLPKTENSTAPEHSFTDLCRGGHAEHPSADIPADSFALDRIAGAYWRGDEKQAMLTRIYGLAFPDAAALTAYRAQVEEAKQRDHKKLGKELGLFTFSDTVGKGLPLWLPKGAIIRRELERFIVDEEVRRGYLHVYTPDLARVELYEKSGHYPHYKDSMYAPIVIDEERFLLRPMTCPHHFELYLAEPHSYRDLPMRIAELAQLYRYEQSGELSGLQRVRTFCLADAHIICADETQAVSEIGNALDLIEYIAGILGLVQGEHYWYRLSLGDRANTEKYFKNDAAWDTAESLLRTHLTERGCHFVEAAGEAAFYGPKIDIQMRNVNGKEDTAFTVQYDFCMPTRFNLAYTAQDGSLHQAVVVHRSSIGAIERIMAFLIEHFAGAFPLWLSPVQVRVLPVGEAHRAYAEEVVALLAGHGLRVESDASNESLGKRIRAAKQGKLPYFIVLGDKEVAARTVQLEGRSGSSAALSLPELADRLVRERDTRASVAPSTPS